MTVDIKLSFNEHINDKLNEANKDVSILWKVQAILPHGTLLSIYKFSIRPLLIMWMWLWPTFQCILFQKNLISSDNAALALKEAMKSSSCEKLYQELGLEYFYQRRWARRLCLLYTFSHPIFIIYYHWWKVVVEMLICLIQFHADLNISRSLAFLMSLVNGISWILTFTNLLCVTFL